jgi:hypothetical protein
MARTWQAIYDSLIVEKETQADLVGLEPVAGETAVGLVAELTSGSKVAIWRLLFRVLAWGLWVHENLFDRHKIEVEAIANDLITGTLRWYQQQCFLFQYGDALTWNGLRYIYDPINAANKIVKRAAVFVSGGVLKVKVAKLDGSGNPTPLSAPELAAFDYYFNTIKFAGTSVDVISVAADTVKLYYNIYFNPLLMAADGSLISDPSVFPVEVAINGYIKNLPFNGILNMTKLTDAIQAATGVVDPVLSNAEAADVSLIYAPIVDNYNATAGHLIVDPSFPLNSTLTYTAVNV